MNKKHIAGAVLALVALGAQAAPVLRPIAGPGASAPVLAEAPAAAVLVDEDFAGFAAGSEAEPDGTYIADKRTGAIPASYTRMPGWSGAAVYQAGGACAILKGMFSDGSGNITQETGFLRTPQGAYAGDLTVSLRAKLLKADKASDKMDIALLNDKGRLEAKSIDVTPEWKSFTVDFSKGEFSGCLVQLAMLSEEVLVDDIRITATQTSIPAPVATEATAYTPDGFTANWQETAQAESYLLTVYEKKVDEAIVIEDFDNLNILPGTNKLDKTAPGFTEGWTVAYGTTRNADHVSQLGYEGSTGMIFRATGEGFVTPEFPRPIMDFSFFAAHPSGQECLSTLVISVLVDGQWGALGNYDVERISAGGEIIRLSSNFPEGVKAVQVMFRKNEQNDAGKDVSIVVDHIRIMTDPEPEPVITDRACAALSEKITGLDPHKDYSYTVKALGAGFRSAESNEVTATGLASPKLSGGQNIGDDCYTAAWEASPKAEGYVVSNYRVYTVAQQAETVQILHEDFSKVAEGSVEAPVGLYNMVNPKALDDYTANPGWYGIATYLAKGMLGTRSYMGIQGIIQTPVLDLSGNDGNFRVSVRVIGDSDATDELLVVQAGMEEYLAFPIKAGEMVQLDYDFECGAAGMPIAFYSYNGYPFYIDEVTVTQVLPQGAKVYTELENRRLEDPEALSTEFKGLASAQNENYAYRVFAYRDFMGSRVYSVSDNAEHVWLRSSGIQNVETTDAEAPARYFRLDGIELPGVPAAPGLYIRRTASTAEKVLVK